MLYGGIEPPNKVFSDTWAWDGKQWTKLLDGGNDGRTHLAMVYDPPCQCIMRFGGKDSGRKSFGDTWRFDKGRWISIGEDGPPVRIDHDLAMDWSRKKVVLFGGKTPDPNGVIYGDTWEWDGSAWRQR